MESYHNSSNIFGRGISGTLLTELTDFNLFAPKFPFFSNFDQHYDFYQKLFFNICIKTLRHGSAKRVGGTQNRAKSLCPFKDPFNLASLAAPILYSESRSERKLFHAFF